MGFSFTAQGYWEDFYRIAAAVAAKSLQLCPTLCDPITLRDGRGRDVGGGFRMGNTCTPVADSWQCIAKPTTLL